MVKRKKFIKNMWTPVGRFSYPYFVSPNKDGKYSTDLFIPKDIFKEKGKLLVEAVMEVGKAEFGSDFNLKDGKYTSPIKDVAKIDKPIIAAIKNTYKISAHSTRTPAEFIGPLKGSDGNIRKLSVDEIKAIKGGDWGKLYIAISPYEFRGKQGVTFYLNGVQFWKADEGFGQSSTLMLETAEELEVEEEETNTTPGKSIAEAAEEVF